jgi:hypothetical protein
MGPFSSSLEKQSEKKEWILGNLIYPRWWPRNPYETLWVWRTVTSLPGMLCSISASSSPSEIWTKHSDLSNSSKGKGSIH